MCDFSLIPQSFQLVKLSCFAGEHVDDHAAVVEKYPTGTVGALDVERRDTLLSEPEFDFLRQSPDLSRRGAVCNDKIIGYYRLVGKLNESYPGAFF